MPPLTYEPNLFPSCITLRVTIFFAACTCLFFSAIFTLNNKISRIMPYKTRTLERFFLQASQQLPVMLLTGPRQTGKTTFLRHLAGENRSYVTLDVPMLRALAREEPALFL